MATVFTKLMDNVEGNVKNGDVFRHWIFCNANGHEADRFQRLSRGNPCRIDVEQIQADYANAGRWGQSYNNACSMPMPAIIVKDRTVHNISLGEALKAIN